MPWPSLAIRSKAVPLVKPLTGFLLLSGGLGLIAPLPSRASADFSGTPPRLLAQDSAPTNVPDLEENTSPPGADTTSPSGAVNQTPSSDEDEGGEGADSMQVEEVHAFDPYSQWLTAAFGYFRNAGVNGSSSSYFAGGGVRYGITLLDRFLADSNRAQDALVIEGGVFYYQVVNFLAQGDSYTLIPLIGTVRYDLSFSESFTLFFYAGFMVNTVFPASGNTVDTTTGKNGLALQTPAAGAGFFYRVGPNWDVRVDVGTDTAQLGLVLRF